MIPILDLTEQYEKLKGPMDAALGAVLRSGRFIMGEQVRSFEAEVAAYLGVKHAVTLNSGTDALLLALRALDVKPGDEVITSPFSFAATTEMICAAGARPVFADIDASFNIDPSQVESLITPRTRAIMPVHLYGKPAGLQRLLEIARRNKLHVVEDCAQAIGAKIGDRMVGTYGDFGCFSFFPTKNLGAYGDGGMVTTDRDELAERVKILRSHGSSKRYYHAVLGVNSRLDELQAAILRVKLPHLESWTDARRERAKTYSAAFQGLAGISAPVESPDERHVYHQYTVRVRRRDRVRERLERAGVQTMIYYPLPLHLQEVHRNLGYKEGSFPAAEAAAAEVLSLPMYPELPHKHQQQVIVSLREALTAGAASNATADLSGG